MDNLRTIRRGLMTADATPGSGLIIRTGTTTQSTATQTISVRPEPGKQPIFAIIEHEAPILTGNGNVGTYYIKHLSPAISIANAQGDYSGTAERTVNNGTAAQVQIPSSSVTWVTDDGTINFTGVQGYMFKPGTYRWCAVYYDDYPVVEEAEA